MLWTGADTDTIITRLSYIDSGSDSYIIDSGSTRVDREFGVFK